GRRGDPRWPIGVQARAWAGRRVHDPRGRRRPGSQHGGAHEHRGIAMGLAGGRAGHGYPAQQRDNLVQSRAWKANSVGSGKRALVNMVPVLGFKRGAPAFTLGAPGGRAIVSAIPQVISNMVDLKAAPQPAIEAPRVHTEGGEVLVSTRVGEKALLGLAKKGHHVVARDESYSSLNFSRPVAIRVTPNGLESGCEQLSAAAAAGH